MARVGKKGKLVLPRDIPVGDALIRALDGIIEHARTVATANPGKSVHEYRKSLRRARALVKLARPLLADAEYDYVARVLRDSQRVASPLRDADVLRAALAEIGDVELPGPVLRPRRDDPAKVLPHEALSLAPLARRFGDALPAKVGWRDLAKGLRRSYRRSRKAMRAARKSRRPEVLHEWRKATKELAYQLELLGPGLGKQGAREGRRFSDLAEQLGEITDLIMLCHHLESSEEQAAKPLRRKLERVADQARKRIAKRRARALRGSRSLYRRRPRRFLADELARAWRRARHRGTNSHKPATAAAQSHEKRSPTVA